MDIVDVEDSNRTSMLERTLFESDRMGMLDSLLSCLFELKKENVEFKGNELISPEIAIEQVEPELQSEIANTTLRNEQCGADFNIGRKLMLKKDKTTMLTLLFGKLFIKSIDILESQDISFTFYQETHTSLMQMLRSKSPRLIQVREKEYKKEKQTESSQLEPIKTSNERNMVGFIDCLVDETTWFCSCKSFQKQMNKTKLQRKSQRTIISSNLQNLFDNLHLSTPSRVLQLVPVPICVHLMSILVVLKNYEQFPQQFDQLVKVRTIFSKIEWINLNSSAI